MRTRVLGGAACAALLSFGVAALAGSAPASAEGGCGSPLSQYSVPPPGLAQTVLYGRTIILRGNYGYTCAWGKIENGSPGDKVWVNRSNYPGHDLSNYPYMGAGQAYIGSGNTSAFTPEAYSDSRTTMWACGQVWNRSTIYCTQPY